MKANELACVFFTSFFLWRITDKWQWLRWQFQYDQKCWFLALRCEERQFFNIFFSLLISMDNKMYNKLDECDEGENTYYHRSVWWSAAEKS